MISRLFNIIVTGSLMLLFFSCQQLKPEQVNIPEYPDLKAMYLEQAAKLHNRSIEKTVSLDGKRETSILQMDTTQWKDELSFFKEMNPNQPEYVGVFQKSDEGGVIQLLLKDDEKGILKKLSLTKAGNTYSNIKATIHEDKDVYVHHREIEVMLSGGLIQSFTIDGYQKMMLKDTVRFGIEVLVN